MLKIRKYFLHKYALYVLNHALSIQESVDFNATDVSKRLIILLEYDHKHHNALPLSIDQLNQIENLDNSWNIESALRTAHYLFSHYIDLFKTSYCIDDSELSISAHSYLAHLALDLIPMSPDDKFMLSLLIDLG